MGVCVYVKLNTSIAFFSIYIKIRNNCIIKYKVALQCPSRQRKRDTHKQHQHLP